MCWRPSETDRTSWPKLGRVRKEKIDRHVEDPMVFEIDRERELKCKELCVNKSGVLRELCWEDEETRLELRKVNASRLG